MTEAASSQPAGPPKAGQASLTEWVRKFFQCESGIDVVARAEAELQQLSLPAGEQCALSRREYKTEGETAGAEPKLLQSPEQILAFIAVWQKLRGEIGIGRQGSAGRLRSAAQGLAEECPEKRNKIYAFLDALEDAEWPQDRGELRKFCNDLLNKFLVEAPHEAIPLVCKSISPAAAFLKAEVPPESRFYAAIEAEAAAQRLRNSPKLSKEACRMVDRMSVDDVKAALERYNDWSNFMDSFRDTGAAAVEQVAEAHTHPFVGAFGTEEEEGH